MDANQRKFEYLESFKRLDAILSQADGARRSSSSPIETN